MDQVQKEVELENVRLRKAVVSFAVEAWRLEFVMQRMLQSMDAKEQSRYTGKVRWFIKNTFAAVEDAGFRIFNCEGHPYEAGIPATPINLDEFSENDSLYVSKMIEPIIIDRNGKVVNTGTVSLQKK